MKKYLVMVCLFILIILTVFVGNRMTHIDLNKNVEIEYGSSNQGIQLLWDDSISKNAEVKVFQDGKDIETLKTDAVGVVEVEIRVTFWLYTKNTSTTYEVVDNKYPVFEPINDFVVKYGEIPDFSDIKAVDEVDGNVEVKIEGEYNPKQSGEYPLSAIATDRNGNTTQQDFKLKVLEKQVAPQVGKPPKPVPNDVTESLISKDMVYVSGHILVNKKHPLPETYAPGENAIARQSLNQMISEMVDLGLYIHPTSVSGYRSYSTQKRLYDNYVLKDGVTIAETYSARPGYSEHQTGLTFDLKHPNGELMGRKDPVAYVKEIDWVANNAHRYGFIVRYPKGKESITGYRYEPWHLRYLGENAKDIYDSGLTMEEYFEVEGGDYK